MRATASIILDTRRKKKNNKYPLKLRITYGKKSRYVNVQEDLTEREFEIMLIIRDKRHPNLKGLDLTTKRNLETIRIKTDQFIAKAEIIILGQKRFNLDNFKSKFLEDEASRQSVFTYFDKEIKRALNKDKIGSASCTESSMNSIKKFMEEKSITQLEFEDVTEDFLYDYEDWMLKKKKSISTVGIYLREMRKVFNSAISDDTISKEIYPFGLRKYVIPSSNNPKKALNQEQLQLLYDYSPVCEWEEWAKDMWFFSYFCQGMNIKDIAYLTNDNINGNMLHFVRRKTAKSSRNKTKTIKVPITAEVQHLIDKYKGRSELYLFPILEQGLTPEKQHKTIKLTVRMINKYFCQIANIVGIKDRVLTYWARHTYATLLKRSNVSVEYISEALGHSSIQTTRAYLDSFEDDFKHEMGNLSASFVRKS